MARRRLRKTKKLCAEADAQRLINLNKEGTSVCAPLASGTLAKNERQARVPHSAHCGRVHLRPSLADGHQAETKGRAILSGRSRSRAGIQAVRKTIELAHCGAGPRPLFQAPGQGPKSTPFFVALEALLCPIQRFPKDTKEVFGILWARFYPRRCSFLGSATTWVSTACLSAGRPRRRRRRARPSTGALPRCVRRRAGLFSNRRNGSPPRGSDCFWQARRPISEKAHRALLRRLVGA